MLGIALGWSAALAAALLGGFAYANPQRFKLILRYNLMATRAVFLDHLQASSNKTDHPQMPGRVAIVTGGSRGIGLEVVRMLLLCDMEVIIACRKISAGENAVKSLREAGILTGKAIVMGLDNGSLDSVKKFVGEIKNAYDKIHILINNAGIMFTPYNITKNNFEEQYQVNYLSHFLLTMLLIPLLKKGSSSEHRSRIINVSSCAHLLGNIDLENINQNKENFITEKAYAQSKLAQVLSTKKLARLFKEKELPIQVYAVHPGIVSTDLLDYSYLKYYKGIGYLIFKNPTQGATPIVFAAINEGLEAKSGLYISNCMESPTNPLANDEALQDAFFETSLKQCQLQNTLF